MLYKQQIGNRKLSALNAASFIVNEQQVGNSEVSATIKSGPSIIEQTAKQQSKSRYIAE